MAATPSRRLALSMSLILHLSDLHLGNTPDQDEVGDYKIEAVTEKDRVTRVRLLRSTLVALSNWLVANNETLDGVIITGDITTQGRPEGFSALPDVLAALGSELPEASRIVVVPGNHDVTWGTRPGSEERYGAFLEGVRQAGYVTPLLDGIDYDGDEPRPSTDPLLLGPNFAIVAVNSADMCGVEEPFQPDAEAELQSLSTSSIISDGLQKDIRRVRMYDMPRVSSRQMAALGGMLHDVPAGRVRIAALHHQLVPVREEEEVKPFESIVNIGAFSAFLGDAGIDVIAHGHKHADHVQTVRLGGATRDHERCAVVASCGTIGGAAGTGQEIAKLIRIGSDLPKLRRVEILTVPAVGAGTQLRKIKTVYDQPTWQQNGTTPFVVISGTTATDVHEKLVETARRNDRKPMHDIVCIVDLGPTALEPPESYQWPVHGSDALSEWFDDIVGWWQDPARAEHKPFTHGQRLRDWSADQAHNQIDQIINILDQDSSSSRGIAVLVNPNTDNIADKRSDFPSFSLLHVWIDGGVLNCTAFFRKQEMTYWWAINVSEIARIQAQVLEALRPTHQELTAGAIRTHASEAVFSDRLPKVNVPLIDRQFWQNPDSLRVLAVAVADHDMPSRDVDIASLLSLIGDWAPQAATPPADGAPVPTQGLAALADMLSVLADRYPTSAARETSELLREMHEANALYREKRNTREASRAYEDWRIPQLARITRFRELLASNADTPSPSSSNVGGQ
jgi:3',5'-cyclic AMP phosphodiesterase CpdA